MKQRKILIEHVLELNAATQEKTYSKKIYENELCNMNVGDEIEIYIPNEIREDKEINFEEVFMLVGYDEQHWYGKITTYDSESNVIKEELVVFEYDS